MLGQPLHTLSGGQRRRVELARILFSDADTLLLDEPTNHLDADSIVWLRDYLKTYRGGFIVISHDVDLVETVVNKVFYLDANRSADRHLQHGLEALPAAARGRREAPQARARQRREEGRRAQLAGRQDARQGHQDRRRAEHGHAAPSKLLAGLEAVRVSDKVAKLRFPDPAPCGKTPLMAEGLSKSYGSLEIFTDVDLAIDRGSRVVILGLNGAGKTTLLRLLAGVETARHRRGRSRATASSSATTPRSTRPSTRTARSWRTCARPRPDLDLVEIRKMLGSFLFSGDDVDKPAGVLSGGEKTRLALATLVVSSRQRAAARRAHQQPRPGQPRGDPRRAAHLHRRGRPGHHDEGAVEALQPERIILLPDGVEDLWGAGLRGPGRAGLIRRAADPSADPLPLMDHSAEA